MTSHYDIVIVNFNSSKCTISCLESAYLINPGKNLNILVVDNCSKDSPIEIIEKFPVAKLIQNKKNAGFAKAVNLAFKHTVADFVILLNPDTILFDGFFDSIYDYMIQNDDVAIIGPAIYEVNGDLQGSARKFPSPFTSFFGRKSLITKYFPNNSITKNEFTCFTGTKRPIEVDWVSGACMIIRRKAFEGIGGFDENIFLYWEDVDLCKRLKEEGWKIVYYPEAKIKHFVGQSSNSRPIASIVHFHYSCYKYFAKHASGFNRVFIPFAFLGLLLRCIFVVLINLIKKNLKNK